MTYSPAEDIATLLNAITYTTLAPIAYQEYEKLAPGHATNGKIIIGEVAKQPQTNVGSTKKFNNYTVEARYEIDNQTTSANIRTVIDDIESAFDTENVATARKYYWELLFEFNNIVKAAYIPFHIRLRQLP